MYFHLSCPAVKNISTGLLSAETNLGLVRDAAGRSEIRWLSTCQVLVSHQIHEALL